MKDSICTHNHPGGGIYSVKDFYTAVGQDAVELRVVGVLTGFPVRYTLTRSPEGWPLASEREMSEFLQNTIPCSQTDAENAIATWKASGDSSFDLTQRLTSVLTVLLEAEELVRQENEPHYPNGEIPESELAILLHPIYRERLNGLGVEYRREWSSYANA